MELTITYLGGYQTTSLYETMLVGCSYKIFISKYDSNQIEVRYRETIIYYTYEQFLKDFEF